LLASINVQISDWVIHNSRKDNGRMLKIGMCVGRNKLSIRHHRVQKVKGEGHMKIEHKISNICRKR